jgi:hypothetical protein
LFGKLFAQTFTGSLYGAGAHVFAVWAYVIANVRHNNTVELNSRALADVIGMTEAEAEAAIAYLCAPDPRSRSQTAAGARLVLEGGFLYTVVNAAHYRGIRNEDERREYNRVKQRECRERKRRQREPGDDDADPMDRADPMDEVA